MTIIKISNGINGINNNAYVSWRIRRKRKRRVATGKRRWHLLRLIALFATHRLACAAQLAPTSSALARIIVYALRFRAATRVIAYQRRSSGISKHAIKPSQHHGASKAGTQAWRATRRQQRGVSSYGVYRAGSGNNLAASENKHHNIT